MTSANRRGFMALLAGTWTAAAFPVSASAIKEADASLPNAIPGMVVVWAAMRPYVPKGWAICNGQNGSPDLRKNFSLHGEYMLCYLMKE